MLNLDRVSFNYPGQSGFKGIRKISFSAGAGEFISILGKSGSGKTTLLKCIYGLEDASEGKILFQGSEVKGPSFNLVPGHEGMGLVSQEFYVLENHSVAENISDKLAGFNEAWKLKRCAGLLRLLGLKDFQNKKAKELSSGQRQRLSIARALALFPKLLLLDEPFSNLDPELKDSILDYIRKEAKKNKSTVIMVTHQAEETLKFSDRIIILKEGKIVQQGSPDEVYFHSKSIEIARLFGKAFRLKNFSSEVKILRPEYLEASDENEGSLKVSVEKDLFRGNCYEVSGTDENKNAISFYSENPMAQNRKEVYLKLREGLFRKA
jgi:ABC-type Fe3+/spermidine/putrescine transport system ATPase subunit